MHGCALGQAAIINHKTGIAMGWLVIIMKN
jgi:hypothetical protein